MPNDKRYERKAKRIREKNAPKPSEPSTFLQFRKKRDEKKIAKAIASGEGTVKTRSRRATNPAAPDQRLHKGSTVKVSSAPSRIDYTGVKTNVTPKTTVSEKQELSTGSLQKPDKGEKKSSSKPGLVLGPAADAANVKARRENPDKVRTRTDTQEKARKDIASGKKLPVGPLTYHYKNKHEYAGEIKNVVTKEPGLHTTVTGGKIGYRPAKKTVDVTEPQKRPPKRKLARREWLINREAKHVTKGERRRKKTESGAGAKYKSYKKVIPLK